jgi:hypothetical protein
VVMVKGGVHLLGITIGPVKIQGDADMPDEFTQTRLVVRSNTFLRVAACAAHTATLSYVCETGPPPPHVALIRVAGPRRPRRLGGDRAVTRVTAVRVQAVIATFRRVLVMVS